MQFIDSTKIITIGGKGGDGVVSFRKEKYVDKGGPNGGDGGHGGDVLFRADSNLNTLQNIRFKEVFEGQPGGNGARQNQHGKNGKHKIVKVPLGTQVKAQDGSLLADIINTDQEYVIAKGGDGGFGNAHFKSASRKTPRIAELGEPGEENEVDLELKLLADVGLVGMPNAGKSTFLGAVTNAKPKIADYPFTTLVPQLGIANSGKTSLVISDIPGLIEGAAEGKGLGHQFLKHIERSKVILHLVDFWHEDPAAVYKQIRKELKQYSKDLSTKPEVIALTKTEGIDQKELTKKINDFKSATKTKSEVLAISSLAKDNIPEVLESLAKKVKKANKAKNPKDKKVNEVDPKALTTITVPLYQQSNDKESWDIKKDSNYFIISGKDIERFAIRTDYANPHSVDRLYDIMHKMGIRARLERMGYQPNGQFRLKIADRLIPKESLIWEDQS